ncbi:MAG: hypothetical protein ACK4PI_07475 [Tepidisphaerales bacterium]
MRIAIEVERAVPGSMEGPSWHETRVVDIDEVTLTPEQRDELERHRSDVIYGAEYRLPAYDGLCLVYSLRTAEPWDVHRAIDAWRSYRLRKLDHEQAVEQVHLMRAVRDLSETRHGRGHAFRP